MLTLQRSQLTAFLSLKMLVFMLFCMIGTFVLSSFSVYQGFHANGDLLIGNAGPNDSLWHIGLMEALDKSVPPDNPLASGEKLEGYHYFNDLVWVGVHRLTGISFITLYLRVAPVILAALFSATTLTLFITHFRKPLIAYLGASIAVIGTNFAYLAPLIFPASNSGHSVFWLDQSVAFGANQQLFLSLSIINLIWIAFIKDRHKYWWIIGGLAGILIGVKVYAGILILPTLVIIGGYELIKNRTWSLAKSTVLAIAITVPLLLLVGNKNGFPFFWHPGWFLKTLFESPDRLNYPEWEMLRLEAMSHSAWHRIVVLWLIAGTFFYVGNFGLKILGLLLVPKVLWQALKKPDYFHLFITIMLGGSLLAPLLLLQKGVVWNTIQFLSYSFVPLTLLLTFFVVEHLKDVRWQVSLLTTILILSLPTTLQTVWSNFQLKSYTVYPAQMVQDISALRTSYLDKELLIGNAHHLSKSSLVPALSGRQVYRTHDVILQILNNFHQERLEYVTAVENGETNCTENQVLVQLRTEKEVLISECPLERLATPSAKPLVVPTTSEVIPNLE
jgi:hypothetical protein